MTTLHRRLLGALGTILTRRTVLAAAFAVAGAATAIGFLPSGASLRSRVEQQPAAAISPELKAEFERWWEAQPRLPMPVSAEGAKVLIVKFTDIQCPYCAMSYFTMKPILARFEAQYPGAVRLVTKDYPLQAECNSAITRSTHLAACDAAAAIRLARQNGKAEALEEWLYANQTSLTPVSIRQAAFRVGGVVNFDVQLPSAIAAVRTDAGLGRLLGIHSTPAFFINGVRCENNGEPLSPPYLEMAITIELRKAGLGK